MNITSIIKKGENETLEFKENFDKEVIESLCAMANKNGGTVLIGVTDKKVIKGVTVGKETLPNWLNQISNSTEPYRSENSVKNYLFEFFFNPVTLYFFKCNSLKSAHGGASAASRLRGNV